MGRGADTLAERNGGSEHIAGRKFWISGGVGGFGLSFAEHFLEAGASDVFLTDIVEQDVADVRIEAMEARLRTKGQAYGNVMYRVCDVTDATAVVDSMRDAGSCMGGLDVVVNNAGVVDEADVSRTLLVNLQSVIEATRAAAVVLDERRTDGAEYSPTIVNIASAAGVYPLRSAPVYAASKHGVVGFGRSAKGVLKSKGIRILTLCPGFAQTGVSLYGGSQSDGSASRDVSKAGLMSVPTVSRALISLLHESVRSGHVLYVGAQAGTFDPFQGETDRFNAAVARHSRESGEVDVQRSAKL